MSPLWFVLIGLALILGGVLIMKNARGLASDAQREFYGPVVPTARDLERDRLTLWQIGAAPDRWTIVGYGLIVMGVVLGFVGLFSTGGITGPSRH